MDRVKQLLKSKVFVYLMVVLLGTCFCTLIWVIASDKITYSTVGGTWEKVNDTTWVMDKDGDGVADVTLVKKGDKWDYIFTVPDTTSSYFAYEDNLPDGYEIVGGVGSRENPVITSPIKYAHTPNIDDMGVQDGSYANGLELNSVVTIPDATKLRVSITYSGDSIDRDWVCMWSGNYPNYKATSDYSTSETGKLGGSTRTTNVYEVPGNTVTFGFRSDSNAYGDGYGYYAVVTDANATSVITNKSTKSELPQTTELVLSKKLVDTSKVPDMSKSFRFDITLSSSDSELQKLLSGTRSFGGVDFTNGVGMVYLGNDGSVTLSGIPVGVDYNIQEVLIDDYEVSWKVGSDTSTGQEVSGTLSDSTEVICTNTKKVVDVPTSDLRVSKEVVDGSGSDVFSFHASFQNLVPNTPYGYKITYEGVEGSTEGSFTSDSSGSGDVSFSLKDTGVCTFEYLPVGTEYQVLEDASDYKASYEILNSVSSYQQKGENVDVNTELSTGKEVIDTDEVATVAFKNTYVGNYTEETLSLDVKKVWEDDDNNSGKRPDFITVRLLMDGDVYETARVDDSTGWGTSFDSLPKYFEDGVTEHEYTIEEDSVPDYTSSISNDGAYSYTITNTLIDVGKLKVSKSVDGVGADTDMNFKFMVSLLKDGKPVSGSFNVNSEMGTKTGSVTFDERGQTTFDLKDGESIVIEGIPSGSNYNVEESSYDDYYPSIDNGTGTISKDAVSEVTVVNTYQEGYNISVRKSVAGNMGNKVRQFKFTLQLSSDLGDLAYSKGIDKGLMTPNQSGLYEFTLCDGEEIIFRNIPSGVDYTVSELDGESSGYNVSSENSSGKVGSNDVSVSFTNTKNGTIFTGANTNTVVMIGVVVGILSMLILFIGFRRKFGGFSK